MCVQFACTQTQMFRFDFVSLSVKKRNGAFFFIYSSSALRKHISQNEMVWILVSCKAFPGKSQTTEVIKKISKMKYYLSVSSVLKLCSTWIYFLLFWYWKPCYFTLKTTRLLSPVNDQSHTSTLISNILPCWKKNSIFIFSEAVAIKLWQLHLILQGMLCLQHNVWSSFLRSICILRSTCMSANKGV